MLNIAYGTAATIEDSLKGCVYITGVERLPIDAVTGESAQHPIDTCNIETLTWNALRVMRVLDSSEFYSSATADAKIDIANEAARFDCIYKALAEVIEWTPEIFYTKMLESRITFSDSDWEQFRKDLIWDFNNLKLAWKTGSFMQTADPHSNRTTYSLERLNDKAIKAGIIT